MASTGFLVSAIKICYLHFDVKYLIIAGQIAVVESLKTIFEQRKIPASIAEKDVHSLASVLKVKQIT